MLYGPFRKIVRGLYLLVLVVSLLSLSEYVGKNAGEMIFVKENQRFMLGKTAFTGDILYEGRRIIYIKRKDIDKTIKLDKNEVTFLGEAISQ